jgi:hypothetical protein
VEDQPERHRGGVFKRWRDILEKVNGLEGELEGMLKGKLGV